MNVKYANTKLIETYTATDGTIYEARETKSGRRYFYKLINGVITPIDGAGYNHYKFWDNYNRTRKAN